MLTGLSKGNLPHVQLFPCCIDVVTTKVIGCIRHEFIDSSIELALVRQRGSAEIAIVLDSIKVALFLHVLEVISPNDQLLQGLNGLVPVSVCRLDVALIANLIIQLIEPLVEILIVEEVEMLVVFLELNLSDFRVADVWFGRRRQSDLIHHIAEDLSDLFLEDLLLDLLMEPASAILPLVQHKRLPAQLYIRDLGPQRRLADDLHFLCKIPWKF